MGWSGGTEIFDRIVDVVKPALDTADYDGEQQEEIYREIIDVLTDHDWDDLCSSEYYGHPVIGPLLGSEEDEDGC